MEGMVTKPGLVKKPTVASNIGTYEPKLFYNGPRPCPSPSPRPLFHASSSQFRNPRTMSLLHRLAHKTPKNPFSIRFLTTVTVTATAGESSAAHYDELINTAGRSKDFPTLINLFNNRFKDGFWNTNKTFNFVTAGDSDLADLSDSLSQLDEGFPRKNAYDLLIARLCKLNRIEDSLQLIKSMKQSKTVPDAITFHPILQELTSKKRKNLKEAWRVIDLMRESEISPDLVSYNFILTAHCAYGDLPAAAGVLSLIREEGMDGDARTYEAMVLGACKVGNVEAAMVLLRRMEDDAPPPLYATFFHVIGALVRLRYYAQAVEFVKIYAGKDKKLGAEIFGNLASKLIERQKFEDVNLLLKEMKERGFTMAPKLSTFYDLNIKD